MVDGVDGQIGHLVQPPVAQEYKKDKDHVVIHIHSMVVKIAKAPGNNSESATKKLVKTF